MSKITVENLRIPAESADRNVRGVAAAWANFNSWTTTYVRDSLNVASLTDDGNGRTTTNFSSAFANTNYALTGGYSRRDNVIPQATNTVTSDLSDTKTVTAFKVKVVYADNAISGLVDSHEVGISFHGDLA